MDFETLRLQISILKKDKAKLLRKKYIERFIDINSEIYNNQIQEKYRFSDGYCYMGYLWDCVKEPDIIDEIYLKLISSNIENVDDVLELDYKKLMECECYLPEDIYIFDDTMKWTIIKTHEDIDGQRYCLKIGDL